jgi:hypothetical protein
MSFTIPADGTPQDGGVSKDKGKASAPIVLDSDSDWESDWDSYTDSDVEMADAELDHEVHEREEVDVDAPSYIVPARPLGAVEAPALVSNVERGMKAFGNIYNYDQVNLPSCGRSIRRSMILILSRSSWTRTATQSHSS